MMLFAIIDSIFFNFRSLNRVEDVEVELGVKAEVGVKVEAGVKAEVGAKTGVKR